MAVGYLYERMFDASWVMSWASNVPVEDQHVRNVTPVSEDILSIEDSVERATAMLPEWKTDPTEDEMVWLQDIGDRAYAIAN